MGTNSGRYYYSSAIDNFIAADSSAVLGELAKRNRGELALTQRNAWIAQIAILSEAVRKYESGHIAFEYVIPRMGKRADNIVIAQGVVFVIEFKVGAESFDYADKVQALDYALDLKNFHEASHEAIIAPILVATKAATPDDEEILFGDDGVCEVLTSNEQSLAGLLDRVIRRAQPSSIDATSWFEARYSPTPTIIEASQALYRGHSVHEITRSEAGADNLGATSDALNRIVDRARVESKKVICLVTGVPGAGKTLAGLNLASTRRNADPDDLEHAVFLSGNQPLVDVLREGLARDEVAQAKYRGERLTKKESLRKSSAFIQNVHHFRDDCLATNGPPVEHVAVFDEAQRAWDRKQTHKFMKLKRGRPDFSQSEPEFLIEAMGRHSDWAAIVCLIGSGQEINTGEAGLGEWVRALCKSEMAWHVFMPEHIEQASEMDCVDLTGLRERVHRDPDLHLGVSIRSFRSEQLSAGIAALLSRNVDHARADLKAVLANFEIVITRSLNNAKDWIRSKARGSERYGILASSNAKRLKPFGIFVGNSVDPRCWFLNSPQDVRSSFAMEDAASEFEVQGLEIDWSLVAWDGDLIYRESDWLPRSFEGTKWKLIHDSRTQQYGLNAYRVLLTRARQGQVIFVPDGEASDPTRLPEFYDPTWRYLKSVGLPEI